ncbi:MAG: hypothetical protein KME59_21020 [Trichormus sp. ATA11-4-KO1]|nr:hypothetical protein [Trichormus sp. ATA11-4-KO1]
MWVLRQSQMPVDPFSCAAGRRSKPRHHLNAKSLVLQEVSCPPGGFRQVACS